MEATPIIGWLSAAVLFATIAAQITRQLRTGQAAGVSPLLYVGQITASGGFAAYAALTGDVIFVVTNAALAAVAVFGLALTLRQRRAERRERREEPARPALVLVASNGAATPPIPRPAPDLPDPRRVVAFRRPGPLHGPRATR
ncbi:MAG: hypothetical protein H6745_20390 [Deltaproteobacteria bacterium]|nr:hypothetical protein [Deltaproteobacteria bacterium]